ncbi:TerD family protein [soil metagenome]
MQVYSSQKLALANQIFVRRCKRVLLNTNSSSKETLPDYYVATVVKTVDALSFCMSAQLIESCRHLSLSELTELKNVLFECLAKEKGAHQKLKPMYPDFPKQVMEMSEAELYLNAMMHYFSSGKYLPAKPKKLFGFITVPQVPQRAPLVETPGLQLLDLTTFDDFELRFKQLLSSNSPTSLFDKADMASYIDFFDGDVERFLPAKITHRENKSYILAQLVMRANTNSGAEQARKFCQLYCDTSTDVLRLAVALSGGDVSLAEAVKFKTFSRSVRKLLLGLLENQGNKIEDMLRWKNRWLRLGEKLHPGEFKNAFPETFAAFDVLRNDLPSETFNSRLEGALEACDVDGALALLKGRPGDFARRLDHLLRISGSKQEDVAFAFGKVAASVSTPVLLQVFHHFKNREQKRPLRVFFPKSQLAKAQAISDLLPELPPLVCQLAAGLCRKTLLERFAQLPPLGSCFIDPELKKYMVPFSQRSASKALRTTSRGSRMPLPDTDILRFFTWWKNGRYRTDIDLSAAVFDENFAFIDALTYYNLKNFGGCHSGDIVDAPDGASEFIDISIEQVLKHHGRYVVMSLLSYTDQPFCDLPECFAGWMARSEPQSGEVFDAKTVQDKLDVSSNSKVSIPAIFDLAERQVIWVDIALTRNPSWYNNVAGNLYGIQLSLKSLVDINKPTLYDLLLLHAEARGQIVDKTVSATTHFSVDDIAFDLTRISSEFMA